MTRKPNSCIHNYRHDDNILLNAATVYLNTEVDRRKCDMLGNMLGPMILYGYLCVLIL